MIRTVIIHPGRHPSPQLTDTIRNYAPSISIVATMKTSAQIRELLQHEKPDLIFLEIYDDVSNDFQTLTALKSYLHKTIIISNSDKYALQAIKHSAIDYILTPFIPRDILQAIDKMKNEKLSREIFKKIDRMINQKSNQNEKKISITTSEGINVINVSSITFVEADRSYCRIHLNSKEQILISKPLKEIELMLSNELFFRAHSTYLINMVFVKLYAKEEGGNISLSDGSLIPLARRRKKEFLLRLNTL